ncbi:MAG: futalosine hydrolase [Chitinophagaceae bacterium]|nr:futalosine hydrolase [Chitinophagaceae bacterium]
MKIVIASATENEVNTTGQWLKNPPPLRGTPFFKGGELALEVDLLVTGVGSTATTYSLTKYIVQHRPDLIIQAGIGGSFTHDLPLETVVLVGKEVFADLGAVENQAITDIFDLGLAAADEHPFTDKMLVNPGIKKWENTGLPIVRGATINMVSSSSMQVNMIKEKYNPVVESMEGAALHFVCLKEGIPFLQIRAISNYCGERDKSKWKLKESIASLNTELQKILKDLV